MTDERVSHCLLDDELVKIMETSFYWNSAEALNEHNIDYAYTLSSYYHDCYRIDL